jgi:hypothetical protein
MVDIGSLNGCGFSAAKSRLTSDVDGAFEDFYGGAADAWD